jgi:hypothetical protein
MENPNLGKELIATDERERQLYHTLTPYINMVAGTQMVSTNWALNKDDLVCEAYLAVARCVRKYLHRVSDDEFCAIARKSIVNAIKEKRRMVYRSCKRRGDINIGSTDILVDRWSSDQDYNDCEIVAMPLYQESCGEDPADIIEAYESIADRLKILNEFDLQVLGCLLGRNDRIPMYVELQSARRRFVRQRVLTTGDCYVIARALCADSSAVKYALRKIRKVLLHGE